MKKGREFYTHRGYQMRRDNMLLTPSMEDYLEMIYRNCLKTGYIRINHLADQLNVQAPSATKIVQKLAKTELLIYEKYGIIQLTDKGKKVGSYLLNRHKTIETFLRIIGVKDNSLLNETEMIEHYLSVDTVKNIEVLNEFFLQNQEIVDKLLEFRKRFNQK